MLGQQKDVLDSIFEMTIAHEVAHQWWAIGVGSDSQRAPWVDESLTNYSAVLYFEDRYGRARAEKMMDLHLRTAYSTGRMLGGSDAPVNLKTSAYSGNMQYGAVVYGKGALYYDALRKLVGDEAFFASLREYYWNYSGKLASPRSLLDIVTRRAPNRKTEIASLYRRWIEETHGDEDITGGTPTGIADLLGGILGGAAGLE
jgi:aminopeptidase N